MTEPKCARERAEETVAWLRDLLKPYTDFHGHEDYFEAQFKAAERDAIERAAKVADEKADQWFKDYKSGDDKTLRTSHREGMSDGAYYIGPAIRSLLT